MKKKLLFWIFISLILISIAYFFVKIYKEPNGFQNLMFKSNELVKKSKDLIKKYKLKTNIKLQDKLNILSKNRYLK